MEKFKSFFILVLAAMVMSSCSGLKKMKKNQDQVKYTVTPEVLEAHAGNVDVTVKGIYPEKYFKKKVILTATPVLTYATGETAYEKVQVVQGEKVQANNQVIKYSGGNFTYTASVPYKEAMKVSELMLRIKAEQGAKSLEFDPVKLADGVIATSTLVTSDAEPTVLPDNFQRITPENEVASIMYLINKSDIRRSELKKDDLAKLKEYMVAVKDDPNREFKSATISSYASPDGEFDFNEKLAGKRGVSAEKYLTKEIKKIKGIDENIIQAKTTAEDWNGFQTEVQKSNIEDKDLILRVLSMYSDPVVREKEIKNMSAAYESLKTDVLPKLRRSQFIIDVNKIGRSDAEILALARTNFKALSVEEMLYAATLTDDVKEKLTFYKATANVYPKEVRAFNNIASLQLAKGDADAALAAIQKAKAIENNDAVKCNTGFAYILKGEYDKAEEAFNSMTAATTESKYGLGIIAVTKGEYDKAANNFGSDASANSALAYILKKDYNKAKTVLEKAPASATGKVGYLKAVVGARLDDKTYMLNGLKEAVAADADWKAYAKTDVEFAKYWNDSSFKAVVK